MKLISAELLEGVWSAAPTPLTGDWKVDVASVRRMVEHHLRLGVRGLFLGGTCGEGAWLPERERRRLVRTAVDAAQGQLPVAVQVTDNSAHRILDNIALSEEDGADLVVIAPPLFIMNIAPDTIKNLYLGAIRASQMPVCLYDLGKHRTFSPSTDVLAELYAEPNVVALKDSSGDADRRDVALAARRQRPNFRLLSGDEFHCVEYLQAGYDGLLLGGAAFHGYLAGLIVEAVALGEIERAQALQQRMNQMMYAVYGGQNIECWLSGEKKMLVELGVFETWNNYPDYPLTRSCLDAINEVLRNEKTVLLPAASTCTTST